MEISECVDPLQLFTAFDGKAIGVLHELALSQIDVQCFKEVLPLWKDIDFLVVIGNSLVEDVAFSAKANPLHYFLLPVLRFIWLLPEDMALEMVLVVWLPRLGAHIAKAFAAGAGHVVAARRPLDCLLAPGTNLGVMGDPLDIRLFADHLLEPLGFLVAFAGVVVVALATETEHLSASAHHRVQRSVHLYAVAAVHPSAKLIVAVGGNEHFA
jgi:hypothetical protein